MTTVRLDPRRLLIFRAVARSGSISGAARDLGWTQPAVSQHLSRLEREVGTLLVSRGPGGVDLTDAGARLVVRADAVAGELRAAEEELAALSQLRVGRVRLAAYPSAAATLVPRAIRATALDHPGLEVGMVEQEPPEATRAVRTGDVDVALVFSYDGGPRDVGGLVWRRVATEPVHLVVPPGHPAAAGATAASPASIASLETLADEPWIGGCARCREHLLACCAAAGFTPRLRHTTDDYVVVQSLVASGLGVTVLPASALSAYRHPEVQVVSCPPLGRRQVGLLHRGGAERVPATAAVIAALVEAAAGEPVAGNSSAVSR